MTLPSQSAGRTPRIERRKDGHRIQRLLRFVDMVRAEAHQALWETAPDILRDEAAAIAEKEAAKSSPDLLAENSKLKGQLEEQAKALTSDATVFESIVNLIDEAVNAKIRNGRLPNVADLLQTIRDTAESQASEARILLSKLEEAGS